MRNIKVFKQFNESSTPESILSELISLGYSNKMASDMLERHRAFVSDTQSAIEIAKSIEDAEFENDNFEEESDVN